MNDNFHNVTRTATGVEDEDEDDHVDGDDMESVHFGYTHPTFAIAVPNSATAIIIIAHTESNKIISPSEL